MFSPLAFAAAMIALPVEVPYSVFSLTTAIFPTVEPGCLAVHQERRVGGTEVGADRRRAEEPLEAAFGQARGGGFAAP